MSDRTNLRISTALCTYNGARWLPEQLQSYQVQLRPVDELIVCDDQSQDNSLRIVEEFAAATTLPVRAARNEVNLRSTANFAKAISLCSGDVIVLSDQDDVWLPQKIERLEKVLDANPMTGMVFSDAQMVDEKLQPLGYTLWDAVRFSPHVRKVFRTNGAFDYLLRRYAVTGATMAFRSEYKDLVLPIPDDWVHDAWIALLISAVAEVAFVEESLILYRQHAAQQIGEKVRGLYGQYLMAKRMDLPYFERLLKGHQAVRQRLAEQARWPVGPEKLAALDEKINFLEQRISMRRGNRLRRLLPIAEQLRRGRYGRFGEGWKSLGQDLLM